MALEKVRGLWSARNHWSRLCPLLFCCFLGLPRFQHDALKTQHDHQLVNGWGRLLLYASWDDTTAAVSPQYEVFETDQI